MDPDKELPVLVLEIKANKEYMSMKLVEVSKVTIDGTLIVSAAMIFIIL
jgi:hypothetical protein